MTKLKLFLKVYYKLVKLGSNYSYRSKSSVLIIILSSLPLYSSVSHTNNSTHKRSRKRTLIHTLIHTFLPKGYSNEIINRISHRRLFLFWFLWAILSNIILLQHAARECDTSTAHTYKFEARVAHAQQADTSAHTYKSSVSQSRAVHFVLQVPWHKPSSQEANHIKSMSHVAAYTGSEALRGVMLDIVPRPHTVTQIPQPQLCFGRFWLQISACNYITHLKL